MDATDLSSMVDRMRGFHIVLNGLPKVLSPNVLKAALRVGSSVVDLGSPTAEMEGAQRDYGVGAPEVMLQPEEFFEQLALRGIKLHERIVH